MSATKYPVALEQAEKPKIETTTFRYNDTDFPIWKKHTTKRLAYDIVNVNQKTIYTAVNMLGLPGWGKTTCTQCLLHDIHDIAPYFNIHWHFKTDILKVDKILERLPKQQPAILVFDDVSWLLQSLANDEKNRILHKLTTVREILDPERKRTQVMLFMDYHYSFAVDKPFRQSPFQVQVSITNEERENYFKTIGHQPANRKKVNMFTQILESAYKFNQFRVQAPQGFEKPYFYYKTDDPFRPAMVFNMSQIHFMLFHRVTCEICSPKKQYDKPDPRMLLELIKAEGIDRVHRNFRFYTFMQTGKPSLLHKRDSRILRFIRDEHRQYKLPLEDIETILGEVKALPKDQQADALTKRFGQLEGREIEKIDQATKDLSKIDKESLEQDQDDINTGFDENDQTPAYRQFQDDNDADDDNTQGEST